MLIKHEIEASSLMSFPRALRDGGQRKQSFLIQLHNQSDSIIYLLLFLVFEKVLISLKKRKKEKEKKEEKLSSLLV